MAFRPIRPVQHESRVCKMRTKSFASILLITKRGRLGSRQVATLFAQQGVSCQRSRFYIGSLLSLGQSTGSIPES